MSDIVPVKERAKNLCAMIDQHYAPEIARMLPKAMSMSAERFLLTAYTVIRQTPALVEATPASLIAALFRSAQAGLEVDGVHAALVPFRDKGTPKAQFIPMYQGLIRMAMNSGLIASCQVPRLVYDSDVFEYEYGLHEKLRHIPSADPDSRTLERMTYGYFVVTLAGGDKVWDVFPRSYFDALRDRSRAKNGPWSTDYGAMAQKSCVRAVMKYVPKASEQAELQRVIARDEKFDVGIADDLAPRLVHELGGVAARQSPATLDDVGLQAHPEAETSADVEAEAASDVATPENFF